MQRMDASSIAHCSAARKIAKDLELKLGESNHILSDAASLCDYGKIYISKNILEKEGKITPLEREIINLHAYFAYKALEEANIADAQTREVILYHHGRHPPHLMEIPEASKETLYYAEMLYSIDAYTALIADRPYRPGFTTEEAIAVMKQEGGHSNTVIEFLEEKKLSTKGD